MLDDRLTGEDTLHTPHVLPFYEICKNDQTTVSVDSEAKLVMSESIRKRIRLNTRFKKIVDETLSEDLLQDTLAHIPRAVKVEPPKQISVLPRLTRILQCNPILN